MAEIKIGRLVLGSYRTNCYFVYREGSPDVVVFDPADQGEKIYNAFTDKGFVVKAILLTHGHFDHIFGVRKLKTLSECKIYAPKMEERLLSDPNLNVSEPMGRPTVVEPDFWLRDGQEITLADITIKTIHTPGHTEGSTSYYIEEAGFLISGDTLFALSIGRSDFPTGSEYTLLESVRNKLFVLPDETKVYPGHGDSTTIGFEKENNPFFQ
ncbi:MAG: MBL fold metallo-hydrolase [Lachnospiraceae bacterium]|nr:MBL fold metallo-hydrolase [Lachnospiraceae bacterium]